MQSHFESEVIPDLKRSHARKEQALTYEAADLKEQARSLQEKLLSLTNEVSALEQKLVEAETEAKIRAEQQRSDLKQAHDQLELVKLEKQQADLQTTKLREASQKENSSLLNEISDLEAQLKTLK